MNSMELMDLEFNGPKFTWRGTRNGQLVEARLDRGLVNKQWLDLWPNTIVTHDIVLGSEHSPIIVQGDPICGNGRWLFRFETYWSKKAECREIVRNCWEK